MAYKRYYRYQLVHTDFEATIYYAQYDTWEIFKVKKGMVLECSFKDPSIYLDNDGDGMLELEITDLKNNTRTIFFDNYDYCFKDTHNNWLFSDDLFILNTLVNSDLLVSQG